MNYIKITKSDIANGFGIRVTLWVSGCSIRCPYCHNKDTWDQNTGRKFDEYAKKVIYGELQKPWIDGITLSGGHPLEEYNVTEIYQLCKEIKKYFPDKTIWLYTGLNFENLMKNDINKRIVELCDVVVDGPFIQSLKDLKLKWRGSSNQRVIDVKKTLSKKEIVLYE